MYIPVSHNFMSYHSNARNLLCIYDCVYIANDVATVLYYWTEMRKATIKRYS